MTGEGGLVEVQATAERTPLSRAHLDELLALAAGGIEHCASAGAGDRARQSPLRAEAVASGAHRGDDGERENCCWPPTTSTSAASSRACWRATKWSAARRGELPPRTGDVRGERARQGPRGRCGDRTGSSIADDSGIEAAALGGAPGRALGALCGRGRHRRGEPGEAAARGAGGQRAGVRVRARLRRSRGGRWSACSRPAAAGRWPRTPRGEGGFGYDPAFLPDEPARAALTMAQLSDEQKDAISHRGRAARALLEWLTRTG